MSLCGAKWLQWAVCVCVHVGWVLRLFKCGSVRVVKGVWIWRHKKRARKSIPKGREAKVTSAQKSTAGRDKFNRGVDSLKAKPLDNCKVYYQNVNKCERSKRNTRVNSTN